jgi:hypothetical protein
MIIAETFVSSGNEKSDGGSEGSICSNACDGDAASSVSSCRSRHSSDMEIVSSGGCRREIEERGLGELSHGDGDGDSDVMPEWADASVRDGEHDGSNYGKCHDSLLGYGIADDDFLNLSSRTELLFPAMFSSAETDAITSEREIATVAKTSRRANRTTNRRNAQRQSNTSASSRYSPMMITLWIVWLKEWIRVECRCNAAIGDRVVSLADSGDGGREWQYDSTSCSSRDRVQHSRPSSTRSPTHDHNATAEFRAHAGIATATTREYPAISRTQEGYGRRMPAVIFNRVDCI